MSKRKFTDVDSDEDEPFMGKQVLPVGNLPENFDGVPMDGLQYLFTVRRDARLLPHVTRAANPYEVPEVPSASPMPSSSNITTHPSLPSVEWRKTFLRRFKNFRKVRVATLFSPARDQFNQALQNSVQPTIHVPAPSSHSSGKMMPEKKERDLWWAFLKGWPTSEWDPPKKPKQPKKNKYTGGTPENYCGGMRAFTDDPGTAWVAYDSTAQMQAYSSVDLQSGQHESPEADGFSDTVPASSSIPLSTSSSSWAIIPPSSSTSLAMTASSGSFSLLADDTSVQNMQDSNIQDKAEIAAVSPPEPTPALLQFIDHRYALHLLMYFTHWITLRLEQGDQSSYTITEAHARWIFVLLSRVDEYITADEMSLLRSLARACICLIEEGKRHPSSSDRRPDETSKYVDERAWWMVVTAVVGIWGQRDLWMDAEAILTKV